MNCPLQLWDEFLPQVELTLNLLRFSRCNPRISANHELYGPFDFTKTPLAPLGTKALIYDAPAVRASWVPHATDGYYVGPASNHYRCLCFYIPTTRRFRFADTWCLYPSHCQVPVISEHDKTLLAANAFLTQIGGTVPTLAQNKIKHIKTIRQYSDSEGDECCTPEGDDYRTSEGGHNVQQHYSARDNSTTPLNSSTHHQGYQPLQHPVQ